MANTPPLKLTRNQLAAFLKDHESIKAFENLFNLTEAIAPEAVQDALVAAESAGASALQAQALALQAANDALSTAAVAEARASVALQTANDARTMAELASTTPLFVMPPGSMGRYAQFLDTTTQTAATANTAYPITYDTVSLSCGIRLKAAAPSEIQVIEPGIYNVQFSVQLDKTSGGTARFWIWFRVNGVDVPNSASEVHIQGNNHEIFSAANILLPLLAGDYVQLMWSVSDTSVQLTSRAAAAPVPAVPSVIVTLTNVVSPACAITQSPPIDTIFANVVLLLHLDGANGSTSFPDSGPLNKSVSRNGDAVISTAQSRFGGASALFDGSGDALLSADSNDWHFGSGNFTVEGFFNASSNASTAHLIGQWGDAPTCSWHVGISSGGVVFFEVSTNGAYQVANSVLSAGGLFTTGSWNHFAFVRSGNLFTLYLNGVSAVTLTASITLFNAAVALSIGNTLSATLQPFHGYLDEIRVTNGTARYTAAFTPPTAPFPDVGP